MQTVQLRPGAVADAQEQVYIAPKPKPVYDACKRVLDILLATLALILLSPLLRIVALAIRISDGGPAFFVQERMTKNARVFKMYKFRSMCQDAEAKLPELMDKNEMTGPAFKLKDDPRVTKIGKFLRKTSIDELPQLLNIIKGDMSIIGPRPPLPREVVQYNDYQMHRLDVKTGLSCYHACRGRSNSTDFDQWIESDLEYIRDRSLLTDLKIIFWTFKIVLTGKGAV